MAPRIVDIAVKNTGSVPKLALTVEKVLSMLKLFYSRFIIAKFKNYPFYKRFYYFYSGLLKFKAYFSKFVISTIL